MEYVVIGNSTAAIGGIEGIRNVDKTGKITVIASEKYHTYSRPLISYLLQGKTDLEKMKYRNDSFYNEMGCDVKLGVRTTAIDSGKGRVVLDTGEAVSYDRLLVATGSTPISPPIVGLEMVKNKYTFMSLEDAQELQSVLTPQSKVLIIGAGLIGLKCGEGIRHRVASVQIVDMANQVLPSILDEASAHMVQAHLEEKGLEFILGDSVSELSESAGKLTSGREVSFDILVIAAGVKPNVELIKSEGGEVNRGIVVDASGRTSLKNVYAAGDCCESLDISSGERRVLALLPNAYRQGECAGRSMAGDSSYFADAIPMNAIGFFGLHIITAGSYIGERIVKETPEGYKAFFLNEGLLKGIILVGDCLENAGVYTALISERTPLDTIDFELLQEKPQLMAFEANKRREWLAH